MIDKNVGNVFEGVLSAEGLKFGIVCGRFNDFFVSRLLSGAVDAITRHGGNAADISVAYVPGSYEIPFAIKKMLETKKYDAVIAQEPCEATEHIIRACLMAAKPFVISLCGTPHALISGEEPETLQEWYAYLSELIGEKGTIQKQELIPGFLCFVAETNCENK